MPKKIQALNAWLSAHDAAQFLSLKHERPIDPKYIRRLSKRAKDPVRTVANSNRPLYNREDLEQVVIRRRG